MNTVEDNHAPEPGKREPDARELAFLRGIFRRVGVALGGLDDGAIQHLSGQLEMASATLKAFQGEVRVSRQ